MARFRIGQRVAIEPGHPVRADGFLKGTVIGRVNQNLVEVKAERFIAPPARATWYAGESFKVRYRTITIEPAWLAPLGR